MLQSCSFFKPSFLSPIKVSLVVTLLWSWYRLIYSSRWLIWPSDMDLDWSFIVSFIYFRYESPIDTLRMANHPFLEFWHQRFPIWVLFPQWYHQSFRRSKNFPWQHDLLEDSLAAVGIPAMESGTKLYISNLDAGVSNDDIRVLLNS